MMVLYIPKLSVPAGSTATISGSCKAPEALELLALTSHSHVHSTRVSGAVDGTEVYSSTSWAEPATVPLAISVAVGSALSWSCTVANSTTRTLGYCNERDTCEMCELIGWAAMAKPWGCAG